MTEKLRFECIHCNAEGTIEITEDPMEFYKIRYCPCCGEELELEEGSVSYTHLTLPTICSV